MSGSLQYSSAVTIPRRTAMLVNSGLLLHRQHGTVYKRCALQEGASKCVSKLLTIYSARAGRRSVQDGRCWCESTRNCAEMKCGQSWQDRPLKEEHVWGPGHAIKMELHGTLLS